MKCKYCKGEITLEDMVSVSKRDRKGNLKYKKDGLTIDSYKVHKSCFERYEKENREWDELYFYIKGEFNFVIVPTNLLIRIQDLRNGTSRVGRQINKKQGYPYNIILGCFKYNRNLIRKHISDKIFNTESQKGNYIMAIIENNIETYNSLNHIQDEQDIRNETFNFISNKDYKGNTDNIDILE